MFLYVCPEVPVDTVRVFFISDFLAESFKSNKNSFYELNSLGIEINMFLQHSQKAF